MAKRKTSILDKKVTLGSTLSSWDRKILELSEKGLKDYVVDKFVRGLVDAHGHACRAYSHKDEFMPDGMSMEAVARLPLKVKQRYVRNIHISGAYSRESLKERMERLIKFKIMYGERKFFGITDTTPDIGLIALETLLELKKQYENDIEILAAAYPVFGLGDDEHRDIFMKGAEKADFLVGLPEKDEETIGFKSSVTYILKAAYNLKKTVQIHVD